MANNRRFKWVGLAAMLIMGLGANAQKVPVFYEHDRKAWVDSVFKSLTPDERLAQLFMVAAYSNRDTAHVNSLERLIRDNKIGGLIFFQGGPVRQANMCNHLQSISKVPLMIAMDAEWGIGMRLDSTIDYPRQMALGAIKDERLLYDFGAETARQMKCMGMHVNFAPVVDVNSNAENPVIDTRSFGENKLQVAKKGIAVMKGMQDNGILACAKHFPGHGDTDSDSHLTLPTIKHPLSRLEDIEFYPFREMIKEGIGSMMVAHLNIPALDTTTNLAATLSPKIVNGLLREQMGFEGLIFTDALNMKGVSQFYKPGEVELKAFLAGNDVMEFAEDVPKAMDLIRQAVLDSIVSQEEIDRRCLKVLNAKAWFGLNRYSPIKIAGLTEALNNGQARSLHDRLVANSLTLLRNKDELIPIAHLENRHIASLVIGDTLGNEFQKMLSKYAQVDHYALASNALTDTLDTLIMKLQMYDVVIVSIHDLSSKRVKNYGVTQPLLDLIGVLNERTKVVVNLFENPYGLSRMPGFENLSTLLFSFERSAVSQRLSAQAIFGGVALSGTLPVTANRMFAYGSGIRTEKTRLAYGDPFQVGMDERILAGVDEITLEAIEAKATPGAQLLIAKDGVVVYEKTFGHHTYEDKEAVLPSDIYDLASITKVAASLLSFMKLVDEKKVDVDDEVSDHLLELKKTNKKKMIFRDMLAHQGRLQAWIPFYQKTLKNGNPNPLYYQTEQSDKFPHEVANNLYMRKDYPDTIYRLINRSDLIEKGQYKYSDLGYYYIKKLVNLEAEQPLDEYATDQFYRPLGLQTMGFRPKDRFELKRIIPTEYDMTFRKQLVHGDVHDPGAAMLGGVGGHAGLFSNANDLAVIMQLFLNKGEYGGKRYISQKTINEFTKCQFCQDGNRRGIGFDKPEPSGKGGPTCECVSYLSFGHTGFTGTMAWADPDKNIVYIFLSNRVYPDAENNKLLKMDVRTRIQQVIYDSLIN